MAGVGGWIQMQAVPLQTLPTGSTTVWDAHEGVRGEVRRAGVGEGGGITYVPVRVRSCSCGHPISTVWIGYRAA